MRHTRAWTHWHAELDVGKAYQHFDAYDADLQAKFKLLGVSVPRNVQLNRLMTHCAKDDSSCIDEGSSAKRAAPAGISKPAKGAFALRRKRRAASKMRQRTMCCMTTYHGHMHAYACMHAYASKRVQWPSYTRMCLHVHMFSCVRMCTHACDPRVHAQVPAMYLPACLHT